MNNLYETINNLSKIEQSVFLVINDIIDNNTVLPDENARNSLKKVAILTLGDRTFSTPYDFISEQIYNNANLNSVQDDEMLVKNIEILKNYVSQNIFENFDYTLFIKNLNKIHRHYKLALIQKNFILRTTLEVEKQADELQLKTEEIKNQMTRIDETKSSIYTDFIAILGVFSSFVFVMFGGFTALSKIIETLSNSNVSLTKTMLVSSCLFGFLITVLYSLLYWISLIIDKPIFNVTCNCEEKPCKNIGHIFNKHRYYLIVIGSCLITFVISIILVICGIN